MSDWTPTLRATLCLALAMLPLVASHGAPSKKQRSVITTAEMRRNAVRNVERHEWARKERDQLLRRLRPYIEADDERIRALVPSQEMPRSSTVSPDHVGPPGSEESHFEATPKASRGFGRKYRYHIDPFTHPWKVQDLQSGQWYPKNDFASYYRSALDGQGKFRFGKGDARFLESGAPDEMSGDDGSGAVAGDRKYFFAAHYAFRIWSELIDVVRDFAQLYTLTNEPLYARKAGVLLDRMADVYPEMDYTPSYRRGMEASTGGSGLGRVQGCIWESWTAQRLSIAYDQIFDALAADGELARFSTRMAQKYSLGDKSTPREIAGHIEEHLLREFVKGVKDGRIAGNPGMRQHAMAAAAIALDNGDETTRLLDWIFEPTGGRLAGILVDGMSRDGFGSECGLGYASIPPKSFFEVARLLAHYPQYPRADLFTTYPKLRNALAGGERVRILDGSILHWGDGGKARNIGAFGYPMSMEMALKGFELYGEPENAVELYNAAQGDPERIPGDIYAARPEEGRSRAMAAVRKGNRQPFRSFNSGGIGFGVLQAPYRSHPRMVALNYGPMGWGHGHGDRLGLHLIAHDVYMATDLGYPTKTGAYPPRIGWTSHTVSHNTVMVNDRVMQRSSSYSGKTRLFAEAGPLRVMDIDGGGAATLRGKGHSHARSSAARLYPDVRTYRRCLVMVDVDGEDSYYIDLFWVRGGSIHRLIQNGGGTVVTSSEKGWEKQARGTVAGEEVPYGKFYDGPESWDYKGSGLMFLNEVERARPEHPFWVEWKVEEPFRQMPPGFEARFRLHHLSALDEAVLANGEAPLGGGGPLRYLHRVRRGKDLRTQFVTVLEPYGKKPFIKACRLVASREEGDEFAAVVEIELADGRRDQVAVTEEGGAVSFGDLDLKGRVGWVRLDAEGALESWGAVDAETLRWKGKPIGSAPAHRGSIAGIDDSDPGNVMISTGLDSLPASLAGRYLVVENRQRADASYRIKAVLPGGILNIGTAALDELHAEREDEAAGFIRNIANGDRFHVSGTLVVHAPPGTETTPPAP
ncbi:MAG TPA: heparinase II/III family protein [Chthoniobacteraceae bacterium]|nr:heparinase II/III family protein [Chthoniobacteraceae bacterium]